MSVSLILNVVFALLALVILIVDCKRGFIKDIVFAARPLLALILARTFGILLGKGLRALVIDRAVENWVRGHVEEFYAEHSDGAGVADFLPDWLNSDSVRAALGGVSSGGTSEEKIAETTEAISEPISAFLGNVIGYLIVFIAALLLLKLVAKILTAILEKLPIVGKLNHILGFVWGIVAALVLLYVLGWVVSLFLPEACEDAAVVRFFRSGWIGKALIWLIPNLS